MVKILANAPEQENVDWQFPLSVNVLVFVVAAMAVWVAGTQLAIVAEAISDRRHLGKAIMGLVFLAAATELPEIVTTLFAAATEQATLLLNNMFGGIALQTAILAIADVSAVRVAITRFPRKPIPILEGCLLTLTLALLHGVIMVGDRAVLGHVGAGSIALAVLYVLVIQMLRRQDRNSVWVPVELPELTANGSKEGLIAALSSDSNYRLYLKFGLSAAAILVFGILLVVSAERIAVQSGLGTSFIGATLLAGSTSLPELSTTIMAVRLHSYTMAISNIFGSNLIMVLLILPADIVYANGPLLLQVDASASFSLVCGIIVTTIYVIGLVVRDHRRIFGMGFDSFAVAGFYLCSLVVLYTLR